MAARHEHRLHLRSHAYLPLYVGEWVGGRAGSWSGARAYAYLPLDSHSCAVIYTAACNIPSVRPSFLPSFPPSPPPFPPPPPPPPLSSRRPPPPPRQKRQKPVRAAQPLRCRGWHQGGPLSLALSRPPPSRPVECAAPSPFPRLHRRTCVCERAQAPAYARAFVWASVYVPAC